jgi:hypothetical protein
MPRLDDGRDVARRSPAKRNMDAAGAGWQVIVSPATRTRVVFPFVARPSSKDGRARSRSPDLRGRKIRHVSDHVKSASHRSREPRQSPCVSATHVAIGESDHGRRSGRALGRSREDRPVAGAGDFSFLSSARPSPRPAPALLATPLVQYFSDRADSRDHDDAKCDRGIETGAAHSGQSPRPSCEGFQPWNVEFVDSTLSGRHQCRQEAVFALHAGTATTLGKPPISR